MSDRTIIAGVDGGGTKTRVLLADDEGRTLATFVGGPSALDPAAPEGAATAIAEAIRGALAAAELPHVTPHTVCVGVAGAGREAARQALWQALVAQEVASDVMVTTDAAVALDDAFGESAGILLIAGTGSVAFGRGPTGVADRTGGWGPLLGDEGGGLWLARRALSAATASADGRESESALLGAIMTVTGVDDPADLIPWAAAQGHDGIAALAPLVLQAAEGGDLRATTLVTLAAEELVLHVRTLARRLFGDERAAISVALSGGLLERGSLLKRLVEHRLKSAVPGAQVRAEKVDAARGALKTAKLLAGVG
jgi:N-acetylglucosamine kinase-like BadF-type ATPase